MVTEENIHIQSQSASERDNFGEGLSPEPYCGPSRESSCLMWDMKMD